MRSQVVHPAPTAKCQDCLQLGQRLKILRTAAFFATHAVPGDPLTSDKAVSPEIRANLEVRYGLDKPLPMTATNGLPPHKQFRFKHASTEGVYTLDYDLESRGTQRLAALAIPMLNALAAGQLIVVDELDASLHHRLTTALVRLFKSGTNQHGAQLVTTVHDTTLLRDGLELDDVWLAEKDNAGASHFTPLTDYRIRSRDDIERVYREGRVGGAPVIGDLALALGDFQ